MKLRPATHADLPLLARWNRELIEDERADDPMTVGQLERRLRTGASLSLDVRVHDERALAFWRAVGMREHAIGFRLP